MQHLEHSIRNIQVKLVLINKLEISIKYATQMHCQQNQKIFPNHSTRGKSIADSKTIEYIYIPRGLEDPPAIFCTLWALLPSMQPRAALFSILYTTSSTRDTYQERSDYFSFFGSPL